MKTANLLDLIIVVLYLLSMLSIGIVFMRFNKDAADYFKGGNRIPWLVAGLSCFMSGFSAWTFTGAAGIAYQDGIVIILLYLGNAVCFMIGYFVFAQRWRRSRITTPMAYLVERYDERTRQLFSIVSVFFQLFLGSSVLYGLGLMASSAFGYPIVWTILGAGTLVLIYCMLGGLWAVVVADFLQAMILLPFCLVLVGAALVRVHGITGLIHSLPPQMVTLHLQGRYNWAYVICWTLMVTVGYNTSVMAQRYFSVDTERSAKKVALLCAVLFVFGACIWFIPPMAMRVLYPDLSKIMPGFANPHETAFAVASLTLLPNGLIGIMLAAMLSSAMANLSGLFNVNASIIAKDVYTILLPRSSAKSNPLLVGRLTTAGVAIAVTMLAVLFAVTGKTVFSVTVTFNTVLALSYGPPALLGLIIKKTPHWSGMASFFVGLTVGSIGSFLLGWGLVMNIIIVAPLSIGAFLLTMAFDRHGSAGSERRNSLFLRLATPVDVSRELGASADQTTRVFRFLSFATGTVGLLCLLLLLTVPASDRLIVVAHSGVTLLIAVALIFVRGKEPGNPLHPPLVMKRINSDPNINR